MIRFKQGNLLAESADALVNTVNCVGVMGRGVALQFKNAFPANYDAYAAACERNEVQPGRMFVYETGELTTPRYIINFPTKRHWRGKSRMADIETGLRSLVHEIRTRGIRSIALPPLGSGLGGLNWSEVRPRIVSALSPLESVDVVVFEPGGQSSPSVASRSSNVPDMTPGRAALVGLTNRYLAGLMDPGVSLLEIHKLMYFMQEAGQPLRLSYTKGHYGPYAENLRHVLRSIEGHLISGYADGGDAPEKQIQLVPGAVRDAEALLCGDEGTREKFKRVVHLVDGFETPFGLELLATVHWVATREMATSIDDAVAATYRWGQRKQRFTRDQIALAHSRLAEDGWLSNLEG